MLPVLDTLPSKSLAYLSVLPKSVCLMTFTSFNPQIILLGFRYTTLVVILKLDIDLKHLTPSTKGKLQDLICKWKAVFSTGPTDLGYTRLVEHEINLTDDKPYREPYRKIPHLSVLPKSVCLMTFTSFNPQIILLGFRYTTLVVILNILTGILFLPGDLTLTTLY
jgi:flagellar biosynthesis protein FliP